MAAPTMKRDDMISSLKSLFVSALRERGFKGSLPHFRRPTQDRIDLLTIQFDRWGGGFVIEISKCPGWPHTALRSTYPAESSQSMGCRPNSPATAGCWSLVQIRRWNAYR